LPSGLSLEPLEGRFLLSVAQGTPLLIQLRFATVADLTPIAAAAGTSLQPSGLPGVMEATGSDPALSALAARLTNSPGVGYVERIGTVHIDQTPNDPYFTNGTMWGMNGAYGIGAPAAWDVSTGSDKVTIADIDTGVDYNQPDLYDNIWINQKEIPLSRMANLTDYDGDGVISFYDLNYTLANGTHPNQGPFKITDINGDGRIDAADILAPMQKDSSGHDTGQGGWADGISEDGDSAHVDDLVGWNFVNNTNNPFDDNGHGTHTAGTIGAMGNNATGVVGVNWNVQIMPVKFLDSSGNGTDANAALAVRYAADHGARVSSNSYGGGSGGSDLEDAITYAASKGDVFVAAAGNSAKNTDINPNYPSAYPNDNIIAVAALNSDGTLAGFSNYGPKTVDLAAPGVNIISTWPGGKYATLSGTSMATPHVTGTVGLLLATHPGWTYQQLIQQVLNTTTADPSLAGKMVTGGYLNAAAALGAPPSGSALFVRTDTTTQGSWQGVYGTQGYNIINNASSYPSYATVTTSGAQSYTWTSSTSDARALQKAAPATDRIATAWYSGTSFTIDINLTDGNTHQVSIYALDWDRQRRVEQVEVIDPNSGAILDNRTISAFSGGEYLTWDIKGHVQLVFTALSGPNAVVSGLFFDPLGSAAFVGTDTTTQGSWQGVYGGQGYNIINNATTYPSYVEVIPSGQSAYTWSGSTTDVRALQKAPPATDRIAAAWYNGTSFTIDLNLTDGAQHKVSVYALDWDMLKRKERIDVVDPSTGTVLDTRTITSFGGGIYLSWTLRGHVQLVVTALSGINAVVSGLFFDSVASASFVGSDTTTQGSWQGLYGTQGYTIINNATSDPSYATVTPSGQTSYTWNGSTSDKRALQKAPPATDRIAAAWYNATSFTVDINLTDSATHKVSIYALDWDQLGRREQIQVLDPATGTVLDTRTISSFGGGEYLTWNLYGHVQLVFTDLSGPNAVVSGLFFA
jgi:subtilisin family serine protease